MAASEVAICNDALIMCGAERITSLSNSDSASRLCNEQYARARDQLLISHPWNFAMKRVQLSSLSELPSGWTDNNEYTYAFTIPADCLRVWDIDDQDEDWDVESGYVFANYTPIQLKYVEKVTNTGRFSAAFDNVLALDLAIKIGYSLTQSAAFIQQLRLMREDAIRAARSFDAQEASSKEILATDFLASRL